MAKKKHVFPRWGKIILWVLGVPIMLVVVAFLGWKIWLSSWQTYENKDLGFSFRYPSTWNIVSSVPISRQQIEEYGPLVFNIDSKKDLPNSPTDPLMSPGGIQVDIREGKSIIEAHKLQKDFSKLKTVKFGSKLGLMDSGVGRTSYSGGLFVYSTSVYIESGNLEYYIHTLTISDTPRLYSKVKAGFYNSIGATILNSFVFD